MTRIKTPEMIDLSVDTLEEIKVRVSSCSLLEEDKKIILSIVIAYSWLQRQLRSTKFTIHRLKKMFGFSTEKRKKIGLKASGKGLGSESQVEELLANQSLSLDELQGIGKELEEKK